MPWSEEEEEEEEKDEEEKEEEEVLVETVLENSKKRKIAFLCDGCTRRLGATGRRPVCAARPAFKMAITAVPAPVSGNPSTLCAFSEKPNSSFTHLNSWLGRSLSGALRA